MNYCLCGLLVKVAATPVHHGLAVHLGQDLEPVRPGFIAHGLDLTPVLLCTVIIRGRVSRSIRRRPSQTKVVVEMTITDRTQGLLEDSPRRLAATVRTAVMMVVVLLRVMVSIATNMCRVQGLFQLRNPVNVVSISTL